MGTGDRSAVANLNAQLLDMLRARPEAAALFSQAHKYSAASDASRAAHGAPLTDRLAKDAAKKAAADRLIEAAVAIALAGLADLDKLNAKPTRAKGKR